MNRGRGLSIPDYRKVVAQWGPRADDLELCAERACAVLTAASVFAPRGWFKSPESRTEPRRAPIDLSSAVIRDLLLAGRNRREDDGSIIEDLGWSLRVVDRTDRWDLANEVSILCGATASTATNSVVVRLTEEAREVAGVDDQLERLLSTMALAFRPAWGAVFTDEHRDLIKPPLGAPFMSWMLYLDRDRGALPRLPESVTVTTLADAGTLIRLPTQWFDSQDNDHVRAAEAVGAVLQETGLLGATRRPR